MFYFFVVVLALSYDACVAVYDAEENLDTIGIIKHWGYPAERHTVTTADGYILELHRIPHGKNQDGQKNGSRPVVFFQHGLECSSSNWIVNLPHQSAGFLFADAGYDVWMGNLRGNTYGSRHVTLSTSSKQFWAFSWDEMAKYDLPALIDYTLATSGRQTLDYVGHSMGTTIAFAQLSTNPTLRAKFNRFFGLAPLATVGHIKGLFRWVADFRHSLEYMLNLFGVNQFAPNNWIIKLYAELVCAAFPDHIHLCSNVLLLFAGPDTSQMNATRIPVYMAHTPAGTSTQNVLHFGQMVNSMQFQAFDYGSPTKNRLHYNGSATPPFYTMDHFDTPTYLFYGSKDWLATPTDVHNSLLPNLPNIVKTTELAGYNHLDFIWGLNATHQIYYPILNILKQSS